MTSYKKQSNFTTYFIILIGILISPLLIINASNKIKQRVKSWHINNENNLKLNILRNLDFTSDSLEVCSRSSEDLVNYFQTGDTNYVTLYAYQEDEEPSNITISLLNILSDEGNDDDTQNYKDHLSSAIIFLVLGFLCIPGWVIFCCCAFCKCNCCKCCKAPNCKIPFFIVVSIINLIFIVCCILGLVNINPLFESLSNTECSILKFISEILDGETKNVLPKWGGISGIIDIFNRTISQIEEMSRENTLSATEIKKREYEEANKTFIDNLKAACTAISGESNYKYQMENVFDLAYYFGTNINGQNFTQGSYADKWVKEAEITNDVNEIYNKLEKVINSNANQAMRDAEDVFLDIGEGIEEIKDNVGEIILDYSKLIDKYGRLILKIVFIVLLIISIVVETFFISLLIFSSKKCDCPKLACSMKILIHIFWNILALLVIIIFLVGGIICLIGTVGKDLFEAISFLISSRNLLAPSPRLFENDAAHYLDICINGDGIITDDLGIENDLGNIGALKTITEKLDQIIEAITTKKRDTNKDVVYDEIMNELNKRLNNQVNYCFVNSITKTNLTLIETLSQLNQQLDSCNINDTWSFSCEANQQGSCTSEINTNKCLNPKSCINELNSRYTSICPDTQEYIGIIDHLFTSIDFASNSNNVNSIANQASIVKNAYRAFLSSADSALSDYTSKFRPFSSIYNNFVGNGSILGLINCAFIGKNVKVMLNYLNDTLGDGFIALGSALVFIGIIMLCCITFSILLLSIIDEASKINKIENEVNNKTILNEINSNLYQNRIVVIPGNMNLNVPKY